MGRVRFFFATLFVVLATPGLAQIDAAPKVHPRLLAEQDEIAPGGTITVALEEDIRDHWHTYWQNPGEAGQPTDIAWHLPPGWKAGAIEWPYPKRLPAGPLMNYGYEGKPWLLVPVTAPKAARPGDTVMLNAHASWLVCSETLCVPEDADLRLPLTISEHPSPPYATIAENFAAARAALPIASPWPVHFSASPTFDVFLAAPNLAVSNAEFFPFDEGIVKGGALQELGHSGRGIVMRLIPGGKAKSLHALKGVLVLTSSDGSVRALTVSADAGVVPVAHFPHEEGMGVVLALAFALLGGLILNLMPCVLPILAMKALAVAAKSGANRSDAAREGLSYGAGAIASFVVLGLAVVVLRAGGEAVGWGFQLQEPRVVAGFALLMFAVGLNLSGVFELSAGITAGDALTRRGGAIGAFFTGVLAVGVAAPCTAPFMAAAIGYALTQGTAIALGVFLFLGLGFALPFIVIGLSPRLLRLLPKPGGWMIHFKQLLAFPMYGAAAWLVWVVAQEAGQTGLAMTLAAMVLLAFAAWVWSASRAARARWHAAGTIAAVAGAILACVAALFAQGTTSAVAAAGSVDAALHAEAYSPARLEQLREERRPVFIDATAAWCITCLVNERVAFSRPDVTKAFARTHTAFLLADWTRRDASITKLLVQHNRPGVPLYLYYKPGATEAQELPQILTPEAVLTAVNEQ